MAIAKVSNKTSKFYYNNAGVIALREKNYKQAEDMFAKSDLKESKQNTAIIDILNGRYREAAAKLAGTGDSNEGLAYILTNQLDKALPVLTHDCPHAAYMRAIVYARKGEMIEVAKQLNKVYENENFKKRSEKDIEFAKFRQQ